MYRDYDESELADFKELKNKTFESIEGLKTGSEQIEFNCTDGSKFKLTYYQDCCANCSIEDINGNVKDLIGNPILLAEEVHSGEPQDYILAQRKVAYEKAKAEYKKVDPDDFYYWGPQPDNDWKAESETWTFYKLSTIKGSVTIRWYGSSNGYYSETATFEKLKGKKNGAS